MWTGSVHSLSFFVCVCVCVCVCQFRDNLLLASHAPEAEWGEVVELVRGVLQKAWGLPVVCECIGPDVPQCLGQCCGWACKAMGMVFVKDENGEGMSFTEPAALTAEWKLRLAEPLLSVACAYPGYLGGIFTGVLKNGLPFTTNWASQIFSTMAWLQVAMLSGYTRGEAMGAMHKGLHRTYATSPHDINSTIKAVYSISYKLPGNRAQVAAHVSQWLTRNAFWEKGQYSSWRLATPVGLGGVTGVWENHMGCLETLAGQD